MTIGAEKKYTFEEYFELEKTSETRHEFIHGKLLPMSGESKDANKIALNIYDLLNPVLEPQCFEIFLHDVRTMIQKGKLYRYPDLVIAPNTDNSDPNAITQPVLIAEVLSESTVNIDRGDKLQEYCKLPTLKHYLIVEQKKKLIELYSKIEDQWVFEFFDESNPKVLLSYFNITLSLDKIYKRINFK